MGKTIIIIIIIAWASWYVMMEDPKEPSKEDDTMKNMKKVMERAKKPVKIKLNFKKSE